MNTTQGPRRIITRIALALAALGCAWMSSGVFAAAMMTRRAASPFAEPAPAGRVGVRLRSADGLAIGGWLAEQPSARVGVVLVHGNGSSRGKLREAADTFSALGATTLAISVRAHGDSEGDYNDIG